ncbi:MAG: hypothetical protein Q4B84_04580, partial [Clostridia bacterium]|nr:hypothetical protein [Clostridia bacterium]
MQDNIKLKIMDLEKGKILIDSGGQTIKIVFGNSKKKEDNLEKNISEMDFNEEDLKEDDDQQIEISFGNSTSKNDNLKKNAKEMDLKEGKNDKKNNEVISKEEEEYVRKKIRETLEKKESETKENEKKEKKEEIIKKIQESEEKKFKNKLEDKKNICPFEPKDLFGKEYEKEEKEAAEKA